MSYMLQPNILVLKEGTENSQGKEQVMNNINACMSLAEMVKTTLVKLLKFTFRVLVEWIK
jgi:T-complex protein 1 subunit eta